MFKRQPKSEDVSDIEFCPYNPSHFVRYVKMGKHVIKCREEYLRNHAAKGTEPDMADCRFCPPGYSIPQPELERHEKTCPHQYIRLFPATKLSKEEIAKAEVVADFCQDTQGPFYGDENWDNDPPYSTTMGYIKVPDNQLRNGAQLREKMRELRLEKEMKEKEIAAEKQRKFEEIINRPYVESDALKELKAAKKKKDDEKKALEAAKAEEEKKEREIKIREEEKKYQAIIHAALEKRQKEREEIKRKENIDLITFD